MDNTAGFSPTFLAFILISLAGVLSSCASGDAETASLMTCGMSAPGAATTALVSGKTGRVWFVQAQRCPAGEGSLTRPFNRIEGALAAAKSGDVILLGPGNYAGGIRLPEGVDLVAAAPGTVTISGAEAGGSGGKGGANGASAGVTVLGAGSATLRGLLIENAVGSGVAATGGRLRLEQVIVRGTRSGGGLAGHGVAVQNVTQLTLVQSQVLDSAGVGVLARGTAKVSIIEPIYLPSPRNAVGKFGIIEPIYVPRSRIAGNGQGGIAIIEPIYSPAGSPNLRLESTRVTQNTGFGVGLWGASVRVVNSAIDGTKVGSAGPWADGLMLAAGLKNGDAVAVQIDARTVITNNARTGVSMLATATLQVAGDVSNNKLCGVWAGSASIVNVTGDAAFGGNTLVGVAVTEGADLQLDGATVRGTVALAVRKRGDDREAGDGIGVFDGARATIRNARLQGNARAGVLVHKAKQLKDGSPDVVISGSVMTGGKYAVVVNGSSKTVKYAHCEIRTRPSERGAVPKHNVQLQ